MKQQEFKDTLIRRAKIHAYMKKLAITPIKKIVYRTEQGIAEDTNKKWGTNYTRQRVNQIIKNN